MFGLVASVLLRWLELNGKLGRIKAIFRKTQVDKDLLAIHKFLGHHSGCKKEMSKMSEYQSI